MPIMSATAIAVAVSIDTLDVSTTRRVRETMLVGLTIVMRRSARRQCGRKSYRAVHHSTTRLRFFSLNLVNGAFPTAFAPAVGHRRLSRELRPHSRTMLIPQRVVFLDTDCSDQRFWPRSEPQANSEGARL